MIDDMELRQQAVKLLSAALTASPEDDEAAWKAYNDFFAPDLLCFEDGEPYVVCVATGAPIWEHEEYVTDPETGEYWIRSEIGLPPRAPVSEGP